MRGSDPRCWYCHKPIGLHVLYRAWDATVIAPPSGVIVCGLDCPKLPVNVEVTAA